MASRIQEILITIFFGLVFYTVFKGDETLSIVSGAGGLIAIVGLIALAAFFLDRK